MSDVPPPPKKKMHAYGEAVGVPDSNLSVSTCSRCGQTRVASPNRVHLFRMQPDGRAFALELPCVPVDHLLKLARNAASGPEEAKSVAVRAVTLMAKHNLVFHPQRPILLSAMAALAGVSEADDRARAALGVARASEGCILVTEAERTVLRRIDVPKRAAAVQRQTFDAVKVAIRGVRDLFASLGVNVEISEGVTLVDSGREVMAAFEDTSREVEGFRRDFEDLFTTSPSAPTKKKPPKAAKKPKPAPKRARPKKTTSAGRKVTAQARPSTPATKKKKKGR